MLLVIEILRIDSETIIVIYDQEEIEINFDDDIGRHYFQTNFNAYTFSDLQIVEYFKWKNEDACLEYQDFGGGLRAELKVCC